MTQEELLAQLRDIHTPTEIAQLVSLEFALWPIIVFLLLLGGILSLRYWRRTAWRREARALLRTIEAERDLDRRWSSLLQLAVQVTRLSRQTRSIATSAPAVIYKNPLVITEQDAAALCAHLRQKIG